MQVSVTTELTEILDWSGLDYEVTSRDRMKRIAYPGFVVADMPYDPRVRADVWVTRFGYPDPPRGVDVLHTEGPGSIWPIVLLDEDEILSRAQARAELDLDPAANIVALIPSVLFEVNRVHEPHDLVFDRFPALRWLRAFDRIVGAPGQLYNEAAVAGVPATWLEADATSRRTRAEQTPPPMIPDAARIAAAWIRSRMPHDGAGSPRG